MSDQKRALILESRGVLRVGGPDRRAFLQGLISNDIEKVTGERAIWSAFLTAQGKFLHEFTIFEDGEDADGAFLIDCEAARLDDLKRRLSMYKLRSKVALEDLRDSQAVLALFGADALDPLGLPAEPGRAGRFGAGPVAVDPRHAGLGARAVLPRAEAEACLREAGFSQATLADYDRRRIPLGLPDGSRDLEVERTILLEAGFDELSGVDWQKGCYLGQELTARTKYRALIKKRLLPVEIEGASPEPGTAILSGSREVGVLRSTVDGLGMALLRLESLEDDLSAGEAKVRVAVPDWVRFQEPPPKP